MKIIFLLIVSGLPFISMSLDAKSILKKMVEVYEKTAQYEVHLNYELFKGENGTKIESMYEGFMLRNGVNVYQKIDQTEVIVTPSFCLKISHPNKGIELMDGVPYKNRDIDFIQTIEQCKEIKLKEEDKYYIITMLIKANSPTPFSRVWVKIKKSNYHLLQVDLLYWHLENFSKEKKTQDLQKPHLRITYHNFSKKLSLKESIFQFATYFQTKGKNKIIPIGPVQSYILKDQRTIK